MIPIKNEREISLMRRACKITAAARALAGEMVRPGVTTKEIDKAVHDFIVSQGATPSFLNYSGFPASTCISVNDIGTSKVTFFWKNFADTTGFVNTLGS